ncbi:hypothetical protein D3C76_1426010 [compost metagenome]
MTNLHRAQLLFNCHVTDQPNGALAAAIDHRKRHQSLILHLDLQPVDGSFHAGRLIAGKPGPVAVVAQRVRLEQIHRMLYRIQRFKTAKTPFQYSTL